VAIEKLVADDFLEWPRGPLISRFMASPSLKPLFEQGVITEAEFLFPSAVKKEIEIFLASRALASDLAGTFTTLLIGRLFFGDYSLGVVDMGKRIAGQIARDRAASNFFLGTGVGSAFYSIFPPAPSFSQVLTSVFLLGILVTLSSYLASALSDPVRKKLGLQHLKLNILLDNLEAALILQTKKQVKQRLLKMK
jgi:hypothetical protein